MRCTVFGLALPPVDTGRSPESADAPFRACEAPELRQTAFPDLQGRHACRSRTRGPRRPRPAYSEVLMPGFPTGSSYERRCGTDRREGTSRRVFEAGWIAEFEPNRRSGRDRRRADRRQPAPLAPAAALQVPLWPGFASAPRREHLSAAAHGPCPPSEAPSRPSCSTADDGLVLGHRAGRAAHAQRSPSPPSSRGDWSPDWTVVEGPARVLERQGLQKVEQLANDAAAAWAFLDGIR
jgi:hypothetical protein